MPPPLPPWAVVVVVAVAVAVVVPGTLMAVTLTYWKPECPVVVEVVRNLYIIYSKLERCMSVFCVRCLSRVPLGHVDICTLMNTSPFLPWFLCVRCLSRVPLGHVGILFLLSGVLALNFVTVADRNMNGLDFGSVLHRHTAARTLVIQNTGSVPVGFTAKVRSPFYTVRALSSAGIKLLPSGTYTVVNTHERPMDQPRYVNDDARVGFTCTRYEFGVPIKLSIWALY
jgi:hypothetical protein